MKFKVIENNFFKFKLEDDSEFLYDGDKIFLWEKRFIVMSIVYKGRSGRSGLCVLEEF